MADQNQNPNYYTSVHSGVDIDAAIAFGNIAKNIEKVYKTIVVEEVDWKTNTSASSSEPQYFCLKNITNQTTFPLVFFVGPNGDRLDLDYRAEFDSSGGVNITFFSNFKAVGTIYVAGFTGWNGG